MLKLSAIVHTQNKVTDKDMERMFFYHPYIGMFLCCIAMPILVLAAVSAGCCAVMLPISFLMGWL